MKLLWHPGIFFCMLGHTRADAARHLGLDTGGNVSEGQPPQSNIEDRVSSVLARTMPLPFENPWEDYSEKSSIEEGTLLDHNGESLSATEDNFPTQSKQRRRHPGSEETEASSSQRHINGLNVNSARPSWNGGNDASSFLVSAAVPVTPPGRALAEFSTARIQDVSVMRPPLASPDSPSYPPAASVEVHDPALDALEEELLQLVVTTGFLGRLLEGEHYRMLAVKLFETRARAFRELAGRFPADNVIHRFFISAENGVLADELEDIRKLKLFVYCLHLEARDMAEGYLFSRRLIQEVSGGPRDFDAIKEMFREAVRDRRLGHLVEDEAERYLLYRFYVALQRKARDEGNEEDLPLVDQYILSLVAAGVLQQELDTEDGRIYIVEKINRRAGVLNGAPLPPPRTPPPSPPTIGSSTASPPKPDPGPKPSDPTPGSAAVQLGTSIHLVSVLSIGAAAIFA